MYTLVYDFDGTFKNPTGISNEAIEILKNFMKNKDNRILIVSESPIDDLIEYVKKIPVRIDLFSISSSAFVYNEKLMYEVVSKKFIENVNKKFKDDIYTAYGGGINTNYIYSYQKRLEAIYPKKYDTTITDLSYYIVAIKTEKKDELINYIVENNLSYDSLGTDPNRSLIRIKHHHFNKKEAVLRYKKESPNNILIGFSDSSYDLPLLDICNVKVAMKNSSWSLKAKADYITEEDENFDGAILILNDICKM